MVKSSNNGIGIDFGAIHMNGIPLLEDGLKYVGIHARVMYHLLASGISLYMNTGRLIPNVYAVDKGSWSPVYIFFYLNKTLLLFRWIPLSASVLTDNW